MRYWTAENDTVSLYFWDRNTTLFDYGHVRKDISGFTGPAPTVVTGYSGESILEFSGTASSQYAIANWSGVSQDYLSTTVFTIDVIAQFPTSGTTDHTLAYWQNNSGTVNPLIFYLGNGKIFSVYIGPSGGGVTLTSSYDVSANSSYFHHLRAVLDTVNKTLTLYACPIISAADCTPQLVGSTSYTGTFSDGDFITLVAGSIKNQSANVCRFDTLRISASNLPKTDTAYTPTAPIQSWQVDPSTVLLLTLNTEGQRDHVIDTVQASDVLQWLGAIPDVNQAYTGGLGGARQFRHASANAYFSLTGGGVTFDGSNFEGCCLEYLFRQEGTAPASQICPFFFGDGGSNNFAIFINTDGTVQGKYGTDVTPKSAVVFPTTGIKHMRINVVAATKLMTVEMGDPGKALTVITSTTVSTWGAGGGSFRFPGIDGNYQSVGPIRVSKIKREDVYPVSQKATSGSAYNSGFN